MICQKCGEPVFGPVSDHKCSGNGHTDLRSPCSICGRTGDAQRNCEWCK